MSTTSMIAPYSDGVPVYLVELQRWLLWRIEQRINRKTGEVNETKPPISYHTGKTCDATDPRSWSDFASVQNALSKSSAWDGFGIALGEVAERDEVLIGLDYDCCLDPETGAVADWAMPFMIAMGSYAEYSPGGEGLKCVARVRRRDFPLLCQMLDIREGDRDQARTRTFGERSNGAKHQPGVQLFLGGRYFTCTGRHWHASPEEVTILQPGQFALLGVLFGPRPTTATAEPGRRAADDEVEPEEAAIRDQLGHAFLANSRLRERWEGGTNGLNDTSRSGRDMSVVGMLISLGFTKGETRAALRLLEHGKLAEEEAAGTGDRYFQRMWERSSASPQPSETQTDVSTIWDPWEDPSPPEWPEGILPPDGERALAEISIRDGVELGALAMTILNAASAAAPKDARFAPYNTNWTVPPIFWLMTIGESGTRKSLLDDFGFCVLRKEQAELWRPHRDIMKQWRSKPVAERGPKPEEPHSFVFNDYTPEALQITLGNTIRGTAIIKDELAGLFEFARYRNSGGESARAFFLSAYEDKDCSVHRVGRDSEYIEHTGVSIFGNIQPRRLKAFQESMESDGLLQRFCPLWVKSALNSRPEVRVGPGLAALYDAISRLCRLNGKRYTTTTDGAQLIHDTETVAKEYATLTDFGLGWPGFCFKLHGTHARLALVLHLLETPDESEVSTDTVQRAHRLIHRFVLQHAHDFYATLPGRGRNLTHDIAGWLLTRGPAKAAPGEPERILASDLTAGVKAARSLGSKAIGEALDPFVTGGWLTPENDYPTNRAWFFNPAIRTRFLERAQLEREQRAEARAIFSRIQAHRQKGGS